MRFSAAEEEVSARVLELVDYDLAKLNEAIALIRYERQIPENKPVFMKDVLDYLMALAPA